MIKLNLNMPSDEDFLEATELKMSKLYLAYSKDDGDCRGVSFRVSDKIAHLWTVNYGGLGYDRIEVSQYTKYREAPNGFKFSVEYTENGGGVCTPRF